MQTLQTIDLDSLSLVTGGQQRGGSGIDYSGTPEQVQERVRERANTCRALDAEAVRLNNGRRNPRAGTDAYAMAQATRGCWASLGR